METDSEMTQMFTFSKSFYSDALTSCGLAGTWKRLPLLWLANSRDSKQLAQGCPFHIQASNLNPHPHHFPYWELRELTHAHHSPPALITSEPGTRQARRACLAQSLLELFTLAHPTPAYPALPYPFHRNHNEGSWPHPPSLRLLTSPCTSPCGPPGHTVTLPLGICEQQTIFSKPIIFWFGGCTIPE